MMSFIVYPSQKFLQEFLPKARSFAFLHVDPILSRISATPEFQVFLGLPRLVFLSGLASNISLTRFLSF